MNLDREEKQWDKNAPWQKSIVQSIKGHSNLSGSGQSEQCHWLCSQRVHGIHGSSHGIQSGLDSICACLGRAFPPSQNL